MRKFLQFSNHLDSDSLPEDTHFVLDLSPSMDETDYPPTRLEAAKEACTALLEVKIDQYTEDRVSIIGFGERAKVVHPLAVVSERSASILKALRKTKADIPSTNIRAGLEKASQLIEAERASEFVSNGIKKLSRLIFEQTESSKNTKKRRSKQRIILLSDGDHNTGRSPEGTSDSLKKAGVFIDVIGIGGSPRAHYFDEPRLKKLASRNSDGSLRYCFIKDTAQLIRKFKTLARHIRVAEE